MRPLTPFRGILIFLFLMAGLLWYSRSDAYKLFMQSGKTVKWENGSATFNVNTSGGPSYSLEAIQSAMQNWTDVGTSPFSFTYGSSTTKSNQSNDGENVLSFGSVSGNSLGYARYWSNSSAHITDCDIVIKQNYSWTQSYLEDIATHEFGHCVPLDHTTASVTMNPTVQPGAKDLAQDDINGLTYLYPNALSSNPTGFTASISGSTVTFSWSALDGATGYRIYYGTSPGSYPASANVGNVTSLVAKNVAAGSYYLTIVGYNNAGDGPSSNELGITVLSAPTGFSSSVSGSTLNLSWSGLNGATGYRIYYGTVSSGRYTGSVDAGNVTSFTATGVPAATYYMALKGYNNHGESGYSSEIKAAVFSKPSGFTATVSGNTVTLRWTSLSGATGYKIYYGTSSGSYIGSMSVGRTTSLTVRSVSANTYYLVLTGYNSAGESQYSSEITITVN